MYIEIDSSATTRIGRRIDGELLEAEFNDEGRARVTEEVGEALAEAVDAVSIVERETQSNQEDDE